MQATITSAFRKHKSDIVDSLTIGLVWIAMIVLANPIGDFPLNDDWVYALAVKSVLETGYFQFPSGSFANVGPQVYWGALFCLPFGFSFTALRFSTLTLGFIGAIAFHALIREVGGNRKTALLGALVLAANPLYFGLANSFMTDVPFVSLVIVAIYFLVRGLQRSSAPDLVLGVLVSFAAILVRQLSLVVLLAFAVAYPIKNGFRLANVVKAVVPVLVGLVLHIVYQRWLIDTGRTPSGQPFAVDDLIPASATGFVMASLRESIIAMIYVGFFALPFVAAFIAVKHSGTEKERSNKLWAVLVIFAVSVLGVVIWKRTTMPLSENILTKAGLGPTLIRDSAYFGINHPTRPAAVEALWVVATVLAVAGGCAVIYYLTVATRRAVAEFANADSRPRTWLYAFIMAMSLVYLVIVLIVANRLAEGRLYDRYLLLYLPLFIVMVCATESDRVSSPRRVNCVLAVILVASYAGFSVAAAHDYLAWNRNRWIATHGLINDGKIRPNQIDGGYEFNGWYLYDRHYVKKPGKSWWWVDDDEYVIASGPMDGYREVRRYTFRRWLLFSESSIFVLRKARQGT